MNRESLYNILNSLGLKKIRKTSNGFVALCPFHDDSHHSFSISKEGLWICFACLEKGNIYKLIKKMNKNVKDYINDIDYISNYLNNKNNDENEKNNELDFSFYPYSNFKEIPTYLLKRLDIETIFKFKLGYSTIKKYENRIIIPVFFNKRFVAFNARAIYDNMIPKYLNSENNIKKYLFNYDNVKPNEPLLIVEGAFNCMSAYEKGFKNTVATFGTSVSNDQIKLISSLNPSEIIIGFDNDSNGAGNKAAKELIKIFDPFFEVSYLNLPIDKDINDLNKEDFWNIVNNRTKI